MKVFYFCHCCCKQLVKFNNFECSDNLNEINHSNHIINVTYTKTVFGMCLKCRIICKEKCQLRGCFNFNFNIARIDFKPPSNDKLTFKDVSNIGWINFIKTFFYRSDIKMHLHFNSFSVEFQPSSN